MDSRYLIIFAYLLKTKDDQNICLVNPEGIHEGKNLAEEIS